MVPLSLFATARRHWTWLRGASERLCQFSLGGRLHRAKNNEGSCTPSWAISQPTGQSLKWMRVCAGGRGIPPPSPTGTSNMQPVLRHAGIVSAQNRLTGELCVAVSPISGCYALWLLRFLQLFCSRSRNCCACCSFSLWSLQVFYP